MSETMLNPMQQAQPKAAPVPLMTKQVLSPRKLALSPVPKRTAPTVLERIAAGDKAAVKDCLDEYGSLVWSLARRYLRNSADAEDAVQDIFISIWSAAGKYDPSIASEITFIGTVARRRLIDQIRKNGRRPVTDSLDSEDTSQTQPAAAGCLEESAEIEKVAAVLESMEPEYRQVLSMSFYEGYSHGEIAALLDMPLGTVKSRSRRGLLHVREQLQLTEQIVAE